jgi:hypothetical protein
MKKISVFVVFGLIVIAIGCRSADPNATFFHALGWEDAKSHLDEYKHVFEACIYEDHWEDRGPGRLAPHHFKATVVKRFKGDWTVSEKIAFVHYVDYRAPTVSNTAAGLLMFVFTNDHTNAEIVLDTGDFGNWSPEIEDALQIIYPTSESR